MKDGKRANQRLSRRDFVKGTTVGAGAAMATGLGRYREWPRRWVGNQPNLQSRPSSNVMSPSWVSESAEWLQLCTPPSSGRRWWPWTRRRPGIGFGGNFILFTQAFHVALKGLKNPVDVLMAAIDKATGGTAPEDLARVYCTHAPRLFDWLKEHGIEIQQLGEGPSMVMPAKKNPWASGPWKEVNKPEGPFDFRKSGGFKAAKHLESLLERARVSILYETAARRLLTGDRDEITGLVIERPDGYHRIEASHVILCTGGFPFNREMVSRYIGPRAGSWVASGTPFNTGDGHHMALDVRAAMRNMNAFYSTIEPLQAQKDPGLRMSFSMWGSRGTSGIVVHERGERFVDESWGRHGISHVMAKETRLNIRFLMVFDQPIYEENKERIDGLTGFGINVHRGDTIEELIEKTGVSPHLVDTLKEFNQAAASSRADRLPVPKTGMVRPIETPPYFGIGVCRGPPTPMADPRSTSTAKSSIWMEESSRGCTGPVTLFPAT